MDLESLGAHTRAAELLREYRRAGGDPGSDRLVWFFAAHWALVRAKVAISPGEWPGAPAEAERLLELAERLAWRARGPLAIVLAGPAASGKSTLAGELGRRTGWPVLSSDATRKHLAGLGPLDRAGPEHYTSEFTTRTYRALGEGAGRALAQAAGVLLDATCSRARDRREMLAAMDGALANVLFVRCAVSLQTALDRAAARIERGDAVSDAGPEIVRDQFRDFEPIEEPAAGMVVQADCEAPTEQQLELVAASADGLLAVPAGACDRGLAAT